MFWIVVTVLLALIGTAGLMVGLFSSYSGTRIIGFATMASAFVLWLVVTFFTSVHLIGQREVGVVHDFSGTVTGHVTSGTAWTAPWQHVKKENIGIQHIDFELGPENSAVSSDQQPIFARLTLNYRVEAENIEQLYKEVGPSWKEILLESRMLQDFKEVTSGFTAAEITTKRPELRQQTRDRFSDELDAYDIEVVDVFVKNIGYSQAYSESIEAKNRQVQAALQAEAKIRQATAEANQKKETAIGEKNAAIQRATGEAEAIRLTGRALRRNPEVLRLRAVEKLSEQASVIICTADRCPSFIPTPTRASSAP